MPQQKSAGPSSGRRMFHRSRGASALSQAVSSSPALAAGRFGIELLESRVLLTASAGGAGIAQSANVSNAVFTSAVASQANSPQTGNGLLATYYNHSDFTAPIVTRLDPTLNFSWDSSPPAPGVNSSGYSVRWVGLIAAPQSGLYTFDLISQGGVKVWLGGQTLIDDSQIHGSALDSAHFQFTAGQTYGLRVDFVDGTLPGQIQLKWSSPSQGMQVVPAAQFFSMPTAPTSLSATASASQVLLSWSGGGGATSYNIFRGSAAGGESAAPFAVGVTGNTFTDTWVNPGSAYFYTVASVNAAGQSSASPEAATVVPLPAPLAPVNFSATTAVNGISLSWSLSSNATSYDIYRGVDTGAEGRAPLQSGVTGGSFTDTTVGTSGTYFYQVVANGPGGSSGKSVEAWADAPLPPVVIDANLAAPHARASIVHTLVRIRWSAVSGANSYNVYRGTSSGNELATPIATDLATTSYSDFHVAAGTIYYYTVEAAGLNGQSIPSGEVAAQTPLPTPSIPGMAQAAAGANGITLTWTGDANSIGFSIYRGDSSGAEDPLALDSTRSSSYVDTTGIPGHTYYYMIQAYGFSGVSSMSSEVSAQVAIAPPAAPASLSASVVSGGISVSWSAVLGATSYNVYRGGSSGTESTIPIQATTGTSFVDPNVVAGQSYFYTVVAFNGGGPGAASPEASATIPFPVPAAPTTLNAVASSNGVQLNWASVAGASKYNVYRATTSGGETSTPYQSGIVATTFTDTAVSGSTQYFYTVTAVGPGGQGAASPEASATTPVVTGTPAPTGLFATATSTSNVTVSWSDVTGETGFTVLRSTNGMDYSSVATVTAGITNYADSGLTPGGNYFYEVVAQGAAGNSPASLPTGVATPAAWSPGTQPVPTPSNGWTTTTPGGLITPQSGHRSNVFYVGDPVTFQLGGNPVSYEVRDYNGNLVDHGGASASTTLKVSQPGWYKLYVYGANTSTQFGNIIGTATFVIFRNDPNFPQLTDLYSGTYAGGETFIQQAMTRVDPTINFNWSNTPPTPAMQTTNFAVVWTGQVQAQFSENYTFSTNSDDGVRLWVNGQEIINDWTAHGPTVDTATVKLVAGQRYEIKMEYFQGLYGSVAQLSWSSPSTPQQIIPASALFATDSATSPGGLTGVYYNGLTSSDPSEDQVMRAITAMGPERFNVDASNPAQAIAQLQADVNSAQALYLGRDSVRPRALMVAFTNGTSNLAGVKQIVTAFQNQIQYWEGQNEPNYKFTGGDYAVVEQAFYNTVKSVNPNLKVIGPATVTIGAGPNGLDWLKQFFNAGGAKAIDALSFHAYNNVLGSLSLARSSMDGLMALLNQYGLQNIELWQTEQGSFSAVYGVYEPRLQGRWTMMEQMVFEQYGLPKEHNFIWYDSSHGFWDQPTWWENDDGTLNPAAPLMRVWSEELFGTKFTQAYDFGKNGNELYIGSLFTGPGKSVATFMSAGQSDGMITLNVQGGTTLHVVSALGVAQDLPIVNGQVQLGVPEVPVYVEMSAGQTISVVQQNWGADLALQQGTTASYSGANNNGINRIINGVQEDYYNGNPPWGDLNYTDPNGWVQISLPKTQTVDRVNIFAMRPWQLAGTLMDFELQYFDGVSGQWKTLDHVQQQPQTFGVFSPVVRTTADSYFNDQFIFQEHFSPVQTSKIRLLIHAVSYGGGATQLVPQSGGQASTTPTLTLSEIEMFGN